MANRYWVGGDGFWSDSTHWAATSGGASGASVPTSVDDVFFDANSGSPQVVAFGGDSCRNFTHSAGNAFFSISLNVYGSFALSAGSTVNSLGLILSATSGSFSLNFAGKVLPSGTQIYVGNSGGTATWTLQSNIVGDGVNYIYFQGGTFVTFNGTTHFSIGGNCNWYLQRSSGGNATVNFNSSVIGSAAWPTYFNFYDLSGQNTTLNLGASTIYVANGAIDGRYNYTSVTSSAGQSFNGDSSGNATFGVQGNSSFSLKAFNNFSSLELSSAFGTMIATTVNAATFTSTSLAWGLSGASVTVSSIVNPAGTSGNVSISNAFTCSGAITHSHVSSGFTPVVYLDTNEGNITISGTITTTLVFIQGASSGTTTTAAITAPAADSFTIAAPAIYLYKNGGPVVLGNVTTSAIYHDGSSNVSVGVITSRVDPAGAYVASFTSLDGPNNGTFTANSFVVGAAGSPRWVVDIWASSITITSTVAATGELSLRTGNLVSPTGTLTVGAAITLAKDAVSGTIADTVNISTGGGSVASIVVTPNSPSTGMGIFNIDITGTLSFTTALTAIDYYLYLAKGGTLELGTTTAFVGAQIMEQSTLALRSGTLTLGGSQEDFLSGERVFYVEDGSVVTNVSSTINFNPPIALPANPYEVSYVFTHGGGTYGALAVSSSINRFDVNGSALYPNMTCTSLSRPGAAYRTSYIKFLQCGTITCTTSITLTGNSLINRLFVYNDDDSSTVTISAPTRTLSNADFRNIVAAGGTLPWSALTSCGDCQGNSNITFTAATTRYPVASGDWESTATWSSSAAGSPGASVPLAQDDVQFTSAAGAINVTTGQRRFLCNNLSISNFSGSLTFSTGLDAFPVTGNSSCAIFGNFERTDGSGTVDGNSSGNATLLVLMKKSGTISASIQKNAPYLNISALNTCNINFASHTLGNLNTYSGDLNVSTNGGTVQFQETLNLDLSGTNGAPNDALPAFYAMGTVRLGSSVVNTSALTIFNGTNSVQTIDGGTSTVNYTLPSSSSTIYVIGATAEGTLHNLNIISGFSTGASLQIIAFTTSFFKWLEITGAITNQGFRLTMSGGANGGFRIGSTGKMLLGTRSAPVIYSARIENNSTLPQESYFVYYRDTVVSGTGSNITAFGASNIGGNSGNITFPSPLKVAAWTATGGSTSWALPNDFGGSFYVVAYGGGGQGAFTNSSNTGRGGAGGGGYSVSYAMSPVLRGQTIWVDAANSTGKRTNTSTPTSGGASWLNTDSNISPSSNFLGVRANGGGVSNSSAAGSGGTGAVGLILLAGGNGGSSGTYGAGGGGGAASFNGAAGRAGGSSSSPTYAGGGGGAGLTTVGGGVTLGTGFGGSGGSPNGGAGGIFPNNPGANAGAGGGGGGGSGAATLTSQTGTLTRIAGTTTVTCTFNTPQTNIVAGTVFISSLTFANVTGTWSRSGSTTVTCTYNNHGLILGQSFYFNRVTGSGLSLPASGTYTVSQVISSSQFRFVSSASATASGTFSIGVDVNAGSFLGTVTAIDSSTFTYVSNSTTYKPGGTFTFTGWGNAGTMQSGGNGTDSSVWSYNYLNGVAATGTIGPGGGGGGAGGGYGGTAIDAGDGGIAAGGGGGGRPFSVGASANGGSGGAGLVLFVYAVGIEDASAQLIG